MVLELNRFASTLRAHDRRHCCDASRFGSGVNVYVCARVRDDDLARKHTPTQPGDCDDE